jgi:hypothetical protein
MRARFLAFAPLLLATACGSSSEGSVPAADSDVADVAPETTTIDSARPDVARDVASDTTADARPDAAPVPPPTPEDIQFTAKNPLPVGEQLLFNDWSATPNTVSSMKPDGTSPLVVFSTIGVWAMGASRNGDRIAFSSPDAKAEEHYGIKIGDAIQSSFLYDAATQKIEVLAFGNINDECHTFSPDGQHLWVCRRYDFTPAGAFSGWRLGRFDVASKAFAFMTLESDTEYALHPQPVVSGATETDVWYTIITKGAKSTRSVVHAPLPTGARVTARTEADHPVLSPDGKRYVYGSYKDARALHVSALDGSGDVKITAAAGTSPAFSPDGTRVAYLLYDAAPNCQHIEIVAADGSDVAAPKRVRDCATTKDFITQLAWIDRK